MSFYKTNSQDANAAWDAYSVDAEALRKRCDDFASMFGGKAVLYADPLRFGGIKFDGPVDTGLWTQADHNNVRQPRRVPRKGSASDVRERVKGNVSRWDSGLPKDRVDFDPVYKAMGKNSSLDFMFHGLSMFRHDDWIYVSTGLAMPALTEILGSEFDAAKAAAAKAVQP